MLAFVVQFIEKKAATKSDAENLKGIMDLMKSAESFAIWLEFTSTSSSSFLNVI